MFYISLIVFVFIMVVISYVLGLLVTQKMDGNPLSIPINFVLGMMLIFAVFQLIAVPSIQLRVGFTTFFYIVLTLLLTLFLISLCLYGKKIGISISRIKINFKAWENWYLIVVSLMIVAVVFRIIRGYLVFSISADADDAYFIGTATTTLVTNSMFQFDAFTGIESARAFHWRYVLSPWPILWAFLSRIFHIHPAIMSRVYLAIVLLIFIVCTYYIIGKALFRNDVTRGMSFTLISLLLLVYSGTRNYDEGVWFLLVMHHGRVLLWLAFLPLCFYFALEIMQGKCRKINWLCLLILVIGSGLLSSMSVALVPLCIGILSIVSFVYNRNIKVAFAMLSCAIPNVILGGLFLLNL